MYWAVFYGYWLLYCSIFIKEKRQLACDVRLCSFCGTIFAVEINNAFSLYCWATGHSQQCGNIGCGTKMLSWSIYVVSNKVYPLFLSDFNQIWSKLTDFHGRPFYQMSCNPSNGSCTDACGGTDGRTGERKDRTDMTEGHMPLSWLWDRMGPYGTARND